ncbi:regulator of chromosome condensation 1/beta-lactamase-inhibitor protein II [Trichoderma chlorosporum]
MDLFATGFNAWNQLSIDQKILKDEPHDLFAFTKVLSAAAIERPVSRLTYTIVRQDGRFAVAGLAPEPQHLELLYTSAEDASGQILTIAQDENSPDCNKLVKQSSSSSPEPDAIFACSPPATQVAAFNTGFVILHSDGTVSTFGDARFEACLGRDIDTPNRPSDVPGPVPDLHEIASANDPVKRVAAGGTAVAALTASGSVYVWGSGASSTASNASGSSHRHRRGHAFQQLSGIPNYTEIDNGKDVVDVALGESHAIALTADGFIYVIGENNNGQLGISKATERADQWINVAFQVAKGSKIVGVAAGPRASFILTSRNTP